jgi:hypothetical protein
MPPNVPTLLEVNFASGPAQDNHLLNRSRQPAALGILKIERLVHVVLERDNRAAAETSVGRDHDLRLRIVDAVCD